MIVEMLVVAMFVVVLCTKITIGKEKRQTEDRSPSNHIVPLYNGIGLTTHGLSDISDLRTFMV